MLNSNIMPSDHFLIIAVERDDVEAVRKLLSSQQHLLGAPGKHGDTALHCAAWNGILDARDSYSCQIFQMLLSAAVNSKKNEILLNKTNIIGETPLTRALAESKTVHDVFTRRAVTMIRYGARLPDTPYAKNIFEKLPPEIQTLIQEKIAAATSPLPKQPPTSPESNQSYQNTLIQYSSQGQGSSGLRHRAATRDPQEFEMKPL